MSRLRKKITIRVNIIHCFFKTRIEKLTTCRLLISRTSSIPVRKGLWVDEIVSYKILNSALEERVSSEVNNTISNEETPKFNFLICFCRWIHIKVINSISQIWDIFASIRLPCDPKSIVFIFRETYKEIL